MYSGHVCIQKGWVFGSRRNLVLICVSQVSILQIIIIKAVFVNDCIGMIIMCLSISCS